MDNSYVKIAKLNSENYEVWKYKVELLLIKEGLWEVVEKDRPAEPNEAWIKNEVENGDMEEHINCMQVMVDKLTALGETLNEKMFIAMLLCSLPDSYNTLITALESRSEEDLTLSMIKGKLIDEYNRRKNASSYLEGSNDRVLKSQAVIKDFNKEQTNLNCYFCKKAGHLKRDCRRYKFWKSRQEKVNQVVEKGNPKDKELCFSAACKRMGSKEWYVDSGATSHMTSDRNFFLDFIPRSSENIRTANGESIKVCGSGIGRLICVTDNYKELVIPIKNVLYVPELDGNLLSVSKLNEKGFKVLFEEGCCKILNSKDVVAIGDLSGNSYTLRTVQKVMMATGQHNNNCQHTWHKKLGHRDPNAIQEIVTQNIATGITIKDCGLRVTSSSSTEAEHIALAEACQKAEWLRRLLQDFGFLQTKPTIIFEDNQSCIKLSDNIKYSKRTKHIDTKIHYVKDLKDRLVVDYRYCPSEYMLADMLTKPL
ncbi:hypothetical protein KPH14_010926 [Odynerus spinipes]|uniref:CCHC-type domain-containing protein n=1 Tax=Odynerus spinipes TaxID=1348599 RepID=A0AAD9VME9_9HYME|nr:hypothetical protein KPH14_010926 [Odynerus spinipes]